MRKAAHMAPRDIPVLIDGPSGTGKEVFARAIHNASQRAKKPFVAVNCGALPSELVESQLFGHVKGAFSGADRRFGGYFVEANGGTLFLDEIGEMPLLAQVKLLRALQEKKVVAVGDTKETSIDVRIIIEREGSGGCGIASGLRPGKSQCRCLGQGYGNE